MSLGLLNLKFILVRKAKFSPKFNYIDFIFLKNLSVVVKKSKWYCLLDLDLNLLIVAGFYILNLIKEVSKPKMSLEMRFSKRSKS